MKRFYVFLCVLGTVCPYYFFIQFVRTNGLNVQLMISQLFANHISAFFATDVIVSSLVLWAFVYSETRRRRIPRWWLAIVANLVVGVSLGLPLFLWLRENAVQQSNPDVERIGST